MSVNQRGGESCRGAPYDQPPVKDEGLYKVSPKHIADQECLDEEESYDITRKFADDPGAELMSLGDIKQMTGEELEV